MNNNTLAIIGTNDLPDKIPNVKILEETKRLLGEKTVLLMQEAEGMRQRSYFIEKILGNPSDFYITSIPGVIIETFQNRELSENPSDIPYRSLQRIHNFSIEKTPLFVHPPGLFEADDTEIIYNEYHPLLTKLLVDGKPKDEASSKAIFILTRHIGECLSHLYGTLNPLSFRYNYKLQKSVNINYTLIGVFKHYPDLFNEFYEAVEQYWEEAKNIGAISRNEDFIGFSLDDLPWFWNCELSDFKFE